MSKESPILSKSFAFALTIIKLYSELQKRNESVLSKQLLRSGTSIGANVEEATAAQSKRDFLSKMSIASKEARETRYWLRLLNKSDLVPVNVSVELQQVEELIRILTSIVKTTGESLNSESKTQNSKLKT
jgi:four helix bundle protein